MTTEVPVATGIVEALAEFLRSDQVLVDDDSRERYSHDRAEWAEFVPPLAVVLAESTADVANTVRWAAAAGLTIVPRGAGTGLSGAANGIPDCVVVSLERMTAVTRIDVDERFAVTEPGVLNDDLRRAVGEKGLWYPPDPASSAISTIGGNVATNAGGICCVKYGVTRDYVLGLTVVLADGDVVELGRKTAKGVAGYDLTALMVGSEGTLGIVTSITVKLLPLAGRDERAVIGSFASLEAAGDAVASVSRAGIVPAALELIDRACLAAVEDWQHLGLPHDAEAMLLARIDQQGGAGTALAQRVADLFTAAGGERVELATEADEIDRLFQARRLAHPALERIGRLLTEDICVPRMAVPEMLRRIQAAASDAEVTIATIAHAGDGNLHPLIVTPYDDPTSGVRAKRAFDRIVADCLELGGTVTGEHGVGLLKLPGVREELGPRVLAMHRAIKGALDPAGVLNPGKGF